ncbi:peptide chain release factor 3 [Hyphomonas sp. WL0036]|uniref:peptide chain release factor 3 n=1 Tax=Hyphomonas sediminis TaxID=2866160 RepID=UPI001C80B0B0|nr:peptide chain release factor 3 [Hyphomonas sediminis]MBY9065284.1 peptide chain release factor 3 [Hyphomonas sediminis]
MSHVTEAARRRTFAIIAHPDAGKTTLTENILLAGGAIRAAGEVAARGETRRTKSDWMKIERDRGISVSASVMTFEFDGYMFNLLDTPGHEDFSEDTYRTLTAADCAVMVLDAAKGIEPQTLKLFEVCRMRDIPIVTFINKMDREALEPIALLDEVQDKLQLDTAPLYWPAASGQRFAGMLDLTKPRFLKYERRPGEPARIGAAEEVPDEEAALKAALDESVYAELSEGAEMAKSLLPEFDRDAFLSGNMTPVVFGSALRHFGVAELLRTLHSYAPGPRDQKAVRKGAAVSISREDPSVSGFVFKIQANMDPNHRDRVAFVRLCSGEFRRGMRLKTTAGKQLNIHNPLMFMAQDREIAETAYAGDVIGVPNHGQLRVGDSLSENGDIQFSGIPNFAPELLRRARVKDPMKAKHLRKALEGLAEEGVTQLFIPSIGSDMIVGAVGQLQFEVMIERMTAEYGLEVMFEQAPYNVARWLASDDPNKLEEFMEKNKSSSGTDLDGAPVYLAKNAWDVGYAQEKNPGIRFTATKERALA